MAEAVLDISFIPLKTEHGGGDLRSSPNGVNEIRRGGPGIRSRYLKPRVGSCHDFCKYGLKHGFQEISDKPVRERVIREGGEGHEWRRTLTSVIREKSNAEIRRQNSNPDHKREAAINPDFLQKGNSSSRMKMTAFPEKELPPLEDTQVSLVNGRTVTSMPLQSKSSAISGKEAHSSFPRWGSSKSKEKERDSSTRRRSKSMIGVSTTSDEKAMVPKDASLPLRNRDRRALSVDVGNFTVLEGEKERDLSTRRSKSIIGVSTTSDEKAVVPKDASLPRRNRVRRALSMDVGNLTVLEVKSDHWNQSHEATVKLNESNDEDMEEKTLHAIEPAVETFNKDSNQNGFSCSGDKRVKENQNKISTAKLHLVKKNAGRSWNGRSSASSLSLSRSKGLKHKQSSSGRNTSSRPSSSSSTMSSSSPSECGHGKSSGTTTGCKGKERKNSKVERSSSSRRMGVSGSGNRTGLVEKLKFRRGRVVELPPENIAPRRLKFRRPRLIEDIYKHESETRKRSNRTKMGEEEELEGMPPLKSTKMRHLEIEIHKRRRHMRKEADDGKLNLPRTRSEKVFLRHRDLKGKKDVQSLYNNVIEETASKLVKSKKSKVKALVGAFESIISLHDTERSPKIGA